MITLAITPGEPAGIGPELMVRLAQGTRDAHWVAVVDPDLLRARAAQLGLPLDILPDVAVGERPDTPGTLHVHPVPLAVPSRAGCLDIANAPYVLATLKAAMEGCLAGRYDAMVTAPVHKEVIARAGVPFTGHTEYLAELAGVTDVLMVLMADRFRVALVTTHVPLAAVPGLLTRARLEAALGLFLNGLRERCGIVRPRLLVAGLNPHAGEGGLLGSEEREVIGPVCEAARASGHAVEGPLSADTLFTPKRLVGIDGVLTMYHDQGLPVLKYAGFGHAVNVTFGLPVIRTSVDHGTALDLAGEGSADTGSLAAAIALAQTMVAHRRASSP